MAGYLSTDPFAGQDSGDGYLSIDPAAGDTEPEKKKRGITDVIQDLGISAWEGTKSMARSVGAAGNTASGDLADVEGYAADQKAAASNSPEAKRALMADIEAKKQAHQDPSLWQATKDVFGSAADNPEGTAQFVVEQAPNSAVSLGAGVVGAKAGAALGSLAGPVGTVVGGGVGFLGGMFLGNALLETGGKAIEKADGGFTKAERGEALREGAVKGAVITGVDAATLGAGSLLAKSFGKAAINAGAQAEARVLADAGVDITSRQAINDALVDPVLRETAQTAGQAAAKQASTAGSKTAMAGTGMAMETVGEGAGEYLGELAATGKADMHGAVLESLAGLTQSAPEVAWNMRNASGNDLSARGMVKAGAAPEIDGAMPADTPIVQADRSFTVAPEPSEAERALTEHKPLTALDRVTEIDSEGTRLAGRLAELDAPDSGYGEMFNQERAELTTQQQTLAAEREQITQSWPAAVTGADTAFSTEAGVPLAGRYALMEADDLQPSHDTNLRPNPIYPPDLQPRERDRAASEMQVSSITQKLDPARLGESADAANGAPIVGADGLVESGNARTIALQRVYQANGLKADQYRQFIAGNADRFGITPESVAGMKKPVLVRVRTTPVNRAEFARQANAATVAAMSPSEQARSDAARMEDVDGLTPDDNGDFTSGTSRDFVRRFMAKLPGTEQAGMIDAGGNLSQTGYSRIRNAVLAKAYGDSPVLLRMVESLDDNLRNVSKALMQAAPTVAKARQAINEGALFDADIAPDLMAAVEELSKLKDDGVSVHDALAQAGMFGDQYSPETRELLQFLADNLRRPRKIADFITTYYQALNAAGNPAQGSLLGEATAPAKGDLLTAARGNQDEPNQGSDVLQRQETGAEDRGQSGDAARDQGGTEGNEAAGASELAAAKAELKAAWDNLAEVTKPKAGTLNSGFDPVPAAVALVRLFKAAYKAGTLNAKAAARYVLSQINTNKEYAHLRGTVDKATLEQAARQALDEFERDGTTSLQGGLFDQPVAGTQGGLFGGMDNQPAAKPAAAKPSEPVEDKPATTEQSLAVGDTVEWDRNGKQARGEVVKAADKRGFLTVKAIATKGSGQKDGAVFNLSAQNLTLVDAEVEAIQPAKKTLQQLTDDALAGTAPLSLADKLRRQADALTKEAQKMLGGIEPGQPVRSTADRNKRDKAAEKMAKSADLLRQADDIEAQGKETAATLTKESDKESQTETPTKDSFNLDRLNRDSNRMENVGFERGEYVRYTLGGKDVFGEIDGISHARREFSVDGLWYPFGFAYKAEKPAAAEKPTVPLSDVIESANNKFGADLGYADRIHSADVHTDLFGRVIAGEVTADEFKASFVALLKNKAGIVAELSGMTKDAIFKRFPGLVYRYKNEKKADVVEAAFRDMVDDFTLGEGYSYGMSSGSRTDSIRAIVERTTDQTLADHAAAVNAAREARTARRSEADAGMADPQTLDDFQRLMAARAQDMDGQVTYRQVMMTLTPEQRERFDILAAEKSRGERAGHREDERTSVRAAGATTGAEIIATKHTRDGYDLFVVKAAERVERDVYNAWNAAAKKLGGWYSAFKGNGAIPGFQFKTREGAEAFQKYVSGGDTQAVHEQAKARRNEFADDRSQTAVERLTEMADSLEAKADASLNQERKANTDKRARQAASAERAANSDKAMAQTMRNIASATENGTAKFLDRIRQKVQVETLYGFVNTAQSDKLRALYPAYADFERHQGEKPNAETADYVTFPSYTAFRSDLAGLGRALLETDGTKKLGQQILKVADDVSDAYLKFAKENIDKVSAFRAKDGARAALPSKAAAEESILRSGYKGAAIVLPLKRSENLIILSPSEAIKRGVWEGDNDKRITLKADFGAELVEKIGKAARRGGKISVPWQFDSAHDKRKRLAGMGIETPAELRAAVREFIALREAPKEADKIKEMERAMIGRRNDGMDFFPTPAGVADEMVEAAGIEDGMRVLEPSAGMGHIAERIRAAGVDPDVVELSNERKELLEAKGFNLVGRDFMDVTEGGYDRILMNPPFGDRRDAEHVQHAYELLKPGGRLVALMGEGVFFGNDKKAQAFRDWLEQVGGTDEKLQEGTFLDPSLPVNTGVNARMVVIDRRAAELQPVLESETDTGVVMFNRSNATQGQPVESVQQTVGALTADWKNAPPIVIATDMNDPAIPQTVRDVDAKQKSQGADGEPDGFIYQGTVYLIAGQLKTEADVARVLAHEALGHAGLRGLYGEALAPILKQIALVRSKEVAAKAKQYGLDVTKEADRLIAAEEVLAEMAQSQPELGFVKRAIAAIRQWLRAHGLKLGLSDADLIANYLLPARAFIENGGKPAGAENAAPAFMLGDSLAAKVWRMLAGDEYMFQNPMPDSFDMEGAAKEIDPGMSAVADKPDLDEQKTGIAKKWYVKMPDGTHAYVMENKQGEVWLDASRLSEGASGGTKLYLLVGSYAEGNGKVFIGDPAGLSDVALIRRTENMLSLALRFGKTDFLRPHEYQMNPDAKLNTVLTNVARPLEWVDGDSANNIEELLKTSYANTLNLFPEVKDVSYNFDKQRFERDGAEFTDFDGIRRRGVGAIRQRGLAKILSTRKSGGSSGKAEDFTPIGSATLKRAAVLNTVARAARSGRGGELLAEIGRVLPGGLKGTPLERVLYSRTPQNTPLTDNPAQEKWLTREARARGFKDIDDLAEKAYPVFEKLAAKWREKHPAEVMLSRGQQTIPGTVVPQAQQITQQPPLGLPPGVSGNQASWDAPENTGFDNLIYKLQNKNIDLKRVIEAVRKSGKVLADLWNPYLQEELFHGRSAKRTLDFVERELNPLLRKAQSHGLTLDEIDGYLHARHAEEANKLIAQRDPGMPDGGSGMTTADARSYLAGLSSSKRSGLADVAAKVDAILAATRQLYAEYGLESQDTIDEWGAMFKHYVPLMREDMDGGMGGLGQGISIKGKEVKHRTGSTRAVVDILANIAMQREKVVVRGEKNRVAMSLAGLAKLNPNPDFWTFDKVPSERVLNEKTGLVETRVDPMFKSRANVIVAKVRVGGGKVEERAVVFNERNERAMRMALALKNMDVAQLEGLMGISAKITRYFSSINTQYNPVFGFVNLTRDVQGALLNLNTTALKDHKKEILSQTFSALSGIYRDARAERKGGAAKSKWSSLWDEFTTEGGQTGYRDLFATSEDRANTIRMTLDPTAWMESNWGKVFTAGGVLKVPLATAQKIATPLFDWLSDFNLTMENAVRLSAYKVALEQGMSKQQAASLAKNLTVNFNRKGQAGQQAGALYAFFNAAMQGTARIAETVTTMEPGQINTLRLSKVGKTIVGGGVLLGVMQAVLLAAMGFDDDEPPEFVRERNIIIPIGGKDYITIPMPLGYHAIPNVGRVLAEVAMDGGKDTGKRLFGLLGTVVESFNPLGGTLSLQTISPTAIDPFVALGTNEDWTGKPIAREDFSSLEQSPGFTRAKDTASGISKAIAEAINYATGGTDYTPGVYSPTPDELDYLFGQVTGGVGRELSKAATTAGAIHSGEELPTYKIPLLGRYYGSSEGAAGQSAKFYENLKESGQHYAEIHGRMQDGLSADEYMDDNPGAQQLAMAGKAFNQQVSKLRKVKRRLIEDGATRDEVKEIETRIAETMADFNAMVAEAED